MSSLQFIDTPAQIQVTFRDAIDVVTPSSNQNVTPTQYKFSMMILGLTQCACTVHKIECADKVSEYPLSLIVVVVDEFPIFMQGHSINPKGDHHRYLLFSSPHLRESWFCACGLHAQTATTLHHQCRLGACVQ